MAAQTNGWTDGRTYGETPYRYVDPAAHTTRRVAYAVTDFGQKLKWLCTVYGMSQANIDKLERVQNILARVIVGALLNIRRD